MSYLSGITEECHVKAKVIRSSGHDLKTRNVGYEPEIF